MIQDRLTAKFQSAKPAKHRAAKVEKTPNAKTPKTPVVTDSYTRGRRLAASFWL